MPKMVITPAQIMDASNKVTNAMGTQKEIMSHIQNIVDAMFGQWEGEAKKNFQVQFEGVKPEYEKFALDLESFADFLRIYSLTMEQLDLGGGH